MNRRGWLLVFSLTLALLLTSAEIIKAAKLAPRVCDVPREASWAPPDVSLCPASTGLWECIKDARYVRDDI